MSPVEKKLIVIGGGAMGVSLLYHLAKLGWQDLLLIEKNELTAGSTWHAAGLCTHFAHSPTIMQMRAYSAKLYGGELSRDTGEPVSFHRCGALRITREPDRMDEFRQVQGLGKFLGYPFEVFPAERLAELYPLAEAGMACSAASTSPGMATSTPPRPLMPWQLAPDLEALKSCATPG